MPESATVSVPRALIDRLSIGLVACAVSLAITTIQGVYREGFDPWHQAMSALSLGPGGWVQKINLIVFGAVLLTTVPAWRTILAGARGGTAYPILTGILGLSFIGVGLFQQDPAPGYNPEKLALQSPTASGIAHLAIAGVGALASVIGFLVMAARLSKDPAWPGWTFYSCLTALLIVGCIAVYGFWSVRPAGFAGTFERAAMLAPMMWMFLFVRRLYQGAPLMTAALSAVPSLQRTRSKFEPVE